MMVKCVGGVSLKDRRRSVDLYSLEVILSNVLLLTFLSVQSVADAVRRGK